MKLTHSTSRRELPFPVGALALAALRLPAMHAVQSPALSAEKQQEVARAAAWAFREVYRLKCENAKLRRELAGQKALELEISA